VGDTSGSAPVGRRTADGTGPSQYLKMHYAGSGAVAVRRRGGAQVLQVLVKGASRAALEALADQAIAKRGAGEDLVAVKQWVLAAKAKLARK